jgi:organic hydroperoxide reductase OsmC/OhrA
MPALMHRTTAEWLGRRTARLGADRKPFVKIAEPRREGDNWSPEDLIVGALETCLLMTFAEIASKEHLPVEAYASEAIGELASRDGVVQLTKVTIRPTVIIDDAKAVQRTLDALDTAHRQCLIANSIKAEVHIEPDVELSACE